MFTRRDRMKKYYTFKSSNKVNRVHVVAWVPKNTPKAILQISHGMIEHIGRYDEFAWYLCDRGIMVVGHDHLGHGRTVENKEDYGYYGECDGSKCVTRDLHTVTVNLRRMYGDIPIFLLGHSMGSFIARRYLMDYGKDIQGAILMGTGNQPLPLIVMGKLLVTMSSLLHGQRYRSEVINDIMFGLYNKRIEKPRTHKDWLSSSEGEVNKYLCDPKCNFIFTNNGMNVLLNTLLYIENEDNIARIPNHMPILLTSGREDPVGNYGKDVLKVYDIYKEHGIEDLSLKLYDGYRHEPLNEVNKENVFEDIYSWIEDRL